MQTPKPRNGFSEAPQKVRPQIVRPPRTTGLESDSASNQTRTPKERSPNISERRSPISPLTEKKRPSRISELESKISQLQEELKKAKDQLSLSESWKKEALENAQQSKKQLAIISLKLEESQNKLSEKSNSEETRVIEHQNISQESEQAWQSKLEAIHQKHSVDASSWASALGEIQQLKVQLDKAAESEAAQYEQAELAKVEIQILKANLIDTLSLVENMKVQLKDSKNSEAQAQALASETLNQLETAKKTVEALRLDGSEVVKAYNSIASELDQSRANVKLLEGLVSKLESDLHNAGGCCSKDSANDLDIAKNQWSQEANQLAAEVCSLKSEVEHLRFALETAERKHHEEQLHSTLQIRSAHEMAERIKAESLLREAELEAELKQAKADFEELKADLMDKETELQGISEENDDLNMKLKSSISCQGNSEIEAKLKKMKENVIDLKASLMDKETELQNILEKNEILKAELGRKEMDRSKVKNDVVIEPEAVRAAEREALMKLDLMLEEADRSSKRIARVTEQLEAAQAANSEMEAELRIIKVQSDQWRKAAEAAAAMLNNGNFMERTEALDIKYNPITERMGSAYNEDMDDDILKKKNGNMLKKIGVLWKRTQV